MWNPLRRSILLASALFIGALATAAGARGAVPVAPADGAKASPTPALAWRLAPGEEANVLELARRPDTAEDGAFADDARKRIVVLQGTQTGYTVPAASPLTAGAWYWHVQTLDLATEPGTAWSAIRKLAIADAPIRLLSFKLGFIRALDELVLRFAYADNSERLGARYRLVFRKRKRGRRVAAASGRVDAGDFQNGEAFVSTRRPRKLRRGARYYARLELRDAAGHVAHSHVVRVRL